MSLPLTLGAYVARAFGATVALVLLALIGLVGLFDFIELLRRAATRAEAGFAVVSTIAGLRLPFVALQIFPFAVLLGGIVAFWRLSRSSELVVARAAGVSAWGFLAGPVLVATALGIAATTGLSPLSSAMLGRAERLDGVYLRNQAGITTLAGGRLWLRQADRVPEATPAGGAGGAPEGVAILAGRPASQGSGRGALRLEEVTVWRLSGDDRPLERVEAPFAVLRPGRWVLDRATVFPLVQGAPSQPRAASDLEFPTDLTPDRIEESFASPDTLSFWALPEFIQLLEASGFSAVRHRLHYQSLLSQPVLAAAMTLLAAGFSMRQARRGGVAPLLGLGVAAGFALFVLDRIAGEFGETGTLPVVLAAWAPAVAGLMLSLALLLHLEDG